MSAPAGKAFVTSGSCRAFVVVRLLRTAFVPPGTSQDPVPPDEIIAFGFPSRLEATPPNTRTVGTISFRLDAYKH